MSWLPSKYELWLHSERESIFWGVSKEHSLLKLVSKTTFSSSSSIVLETKERKKERKKEREKTKIIKQKKEEDIYLELMK